MTSHPIWAKLDLGLRKLRIAAAILLAFPAGVLSALTRAPILLLPVLPDCLKMTLILPVIIPLVTLGASGLFVYCVFRRAARVLFNRRPRIGRKQAPAPAYKDVSSAAAVDSGREVLHEAPAPSAKGRVPWTMRIEIPQSASYPSPPLTQSSRSSSICLDSPGPLTPAGLASAEDPLARPTRSQILEKSSQQLGGEELEQVEKLVARLLSDGSDKLTPVPRRVASLAAR